MGEIRDFNASRRESVKGFCAGESASAAPGISLAAGIPIGSISCNSASSFGTGVESAISLTSGGGIVSVDPASPPDARGVSSHSGVPGVTSDFVSSSKKAMPGNSCSSSGTAKDSGSSGIMVNSTGTGSVSTAVVYGGSFSGATERRIEGRIPRSSSAGGKPVLMVSWRTDTISPMSFFNHSSRSLFLCSPGCWEKISTIGSESPVLLVSENERVMTSSPVAIFPPFTDNMVESGIVCGWKWAYLMSTRMRWRVVSRTSYCTELIHTLSVVRIINSPLFR